MTGFAVDAQFQPEDTKNSKNAPPPQSAKEETKIEKHIEDKMTTAQGEDLYSIEIKVKRLSGTKLF
jgi:hypothetical protein